MRYLEQQAPRKGPRFPLRHGVNVLGRAPGVDVFLPDPSLSRRHAELRVEGDVCVLRDLASHNGTHLNGAPLMGEAVVVAGDQVQCGDVLLILREGVTSSPDAAAADARGPSQTVSLKAAWGAATDPASRRLATLLQAGELLARPGFDRQIQSRILDLAAEILPIDRAVLLTVAEGGGLSVAASRVASGSSERPYSESIVRYAIEKQIAAKFDDAQGDERLGTAASIVAQAIRCAMCAPLVVDDQVLGAIYVDNRASTHSFAPADLELLAGFANQAAVALSNARLRAQLEQAAVRQSTLQRFFPPATAAKLVASGGDLGVSEFSVTALFSDISAFTDMSSWMAPRDVVALLNAYFPPMAQIVFDRDGTLEKYVGDALMAVWGAPYGHIDDADRALEAAVEMHEAVERMRDQLPHPIYIHIGLHSGVVALANIGSAEYLQVAMIGDAANTSARVCSVAGDGELVITRDTAERLTRAHFPLTPMPPTKVKGKAEPLQLYRVEWRRG